MQAGEFLMDRLKISAVLTMLVVLFAATAISGCTTGSMNVSPTPGPTAAPTAQPVVEPTATPTAAPTAAPQATPTQVPAATHDFTRGLGPNPTMGPWTPGDDTFIPTPTPAAWYLLSMPWIDQKIQVGGPVVLKVTGNVESPLNLKTIDLKGYPQKTSTWINTVNASKSYTGTGPELNAILDAAKPKSSASSIKLISSDGSTYTLSLSDIRSDSNAIVSFVGDGSLRSVIPTQSAGKAQLRGLVEIQVI